MKAFGCTSILAYLNMLKFAQNQVQIFYSTFFYALLISNNEKHQMISRVCFFALRRFQCFCVFFHALVCCKFQNVYTYSVHTVFRGKNIVIGNRQKIYSKKTIIYAFFGKRIFVFDLIKSNISNYTMYIMKFLLNRRIYRFSL